jgi:hypothetical protein
MFGERRSHERIKINRVARIYADSIGVTCECTISDISEGGARLFVSDVQLPDRFLLQIFGDKAAREECKVAWRLGGEMGVQFVTKSLEQARSEAINKLRALTQQKLKQAG